MAKVPRIMPSEASPTNQSAATPIGAVKSNLGGIVSSLGQTGQEISSTYEKAVLLGETTRAQNAQNIKIETLKQQAANDPDISAGRQKFYADEINKTIDDSSQFITLATARNSFTQEAKQNAALAQLHVNGLFTKKVIDQNKADLETYMQVQEDKFLNSFSPEAKTSAVLERNRKLDEAVGGGYMSRDDAAKQKEKLDKDWEEAQVLVERHADPQNTLKELQKGSSGRYKNISPQQREKLITSTIMFQKRLDNESDQVTAIAKNQAEAGLVDKYFGGGLTEKDVEDQHNKGLISDDFAESMLKSLQSDSATTSSSVNAKAYMDIVDKLHDQNAKPEDIRKSILDANAKGQISASVAQRLYSVHMRESEEGKKSLADLISGDNKQKDMAAIIKQDQMLQSKAKEKRGFLKSAIDHIKSWGKHQEKSPEDVAALQQEFFQKMDDGKKGHEDALGVAREVVHKANVQSNPNVAKAPKEGVIMLDAKGNKARVFPDGSYQEVNE